MKSKNKKVKSIKKMRGKKRLLARVLGVLIIAGVLGYGLYFFLSRNERTSPQSSPAAATNSSINLDPPTDEEKKQSEDIKNKLNQPTSPSPGAAADGRQQVTPIIVNADKYGANAYVPGVFEEGGVCTATFTHSGDSIVVTSKGFQNSNYTGCEPLTLQGPLNIQGDWTVIVSYSSSTSIGNSAPFGPFQVN